MQEAQPGNRRSHPHHRAGLKPARRQRPILCPAHACIIIALEELIESGGTAGQQGRAEKGVEHQRVIQGASEPDIEADECSEQDQQSKPGFKEVGVNSDPTLFSRRGFDIGFDGNFHLNLPRKSVNRNVSGKNPKPSGQQA
ncbi:hypothetical protein SDC9_154444 [bioreactor metagenome]|uniref:Uncharacterized protein n=1 Tax=bioreactor metagenome TaxID=1076179 RepID=A0A645EYP4_9ZZZZ